MDRPKPSISILFIVALIIALFASPAAAQSGRTRPRVQPSGTTTAPPPEPVKVPEATSVVKQEQVGTASRFVLQNGITVIIKELHSAPLVAVQASFPAGANAESESQTGIARLLQRMALKGTILRPNALDDMRAIGGVLNADISYSSADYSVVAPAKKWKEAIDIQSDLLMNPVLDGNAMQREIPSVISEAKWRAGLLLDDLRPDMPFAFSNISPSFVSDDASAYSLARMLSMSFAGTPAGRWRPASVESLRALTRDQLQAFYQSHYRPDQLTITIVGDVITFTTLVEIQNLYGVFGAAPPAANSKPARPAATPMSKPVAAHTNRPPAAQPAQPTQPAQQPTAVPAAAQQPAKPETGTAPPGDNGQPKLRYAEERSDINQTIVTVGFRVPGASSQERATLELLAAMLGQGRASRLQSSLIDGQTLATRVAARYIPVADDGVIAVQMQVASDAKGTVLLDRAESALMQELDDARREIPSEGEMARARAIAEKQLLNRSEGYASRAALVAEFEAAKLNLRDTLDYRARLRAVHAEDIQRAAARYFTLANLTVHEYEPTTAAPRNLDANSFTATVQALVAGLSQAPEAIKPRNADAATAPAVIAQGAEPAADQSLSESLMPVAVKDFSTLNGPRAFVREDHSVPLVTIALLFQGGRVVEDENTSGITELMLRSILRGTPRRIAPQLANEWDQLGAEIDIVTEADFFGYIMSVPPRNADRALRLLRDVIEEPAFRGTDVQRARLMQFGAIRSHLDANAERARELMNQALWVGHPYFLPLHGREEAIAKITEDQLSELHGRAVKRQQPVAIIVGDTNGSSLVSSQIAEGFKRRDLEKSLQVKIPVAKSGERAESRRREQTSLAVGFAGPPRTEANSLLAIELMKAAMNGEGGRLLAELHDRQGLALAATLDSDTSFIGGDIYAELVADAGNETKARAALIAELNKLATDGLSTEESARAHSVAITANLMRLQDQAIHALEYARAGIDNGKYTEAPAFVTEVDDFAAQIEKITSDDAKRAAAAYFKPVNATGIVHGAAATAAQPAKQP